MRSGGTDLNAGSGSTLLHLEQDSDFGRVRLKSSCSRRRLRRVRYITVEPQDGSMDQTVCKPGSVPPAVTRGRDGHSSGPSVAGRFSRPTRVSGPATACRSCDRRDTPIWSCSRRGLPCRPGHPVRGGLLPHPFTLTPLRQRLRGAVCFLWRYPWGHPRRALPAALSPWSPDFPPSFTACAVSEGDRPTVWSAIRVGGGGARVKGADASASS